MINKPAAEKNTLTKNLSKINVRLFLQYKNYNNDVIIKGLIGIIYCSIFLPLGQKRGKIIDFINNTIPRLTNISKL